MNSKNTERIAVVNEQFNELKAKIIITERYKENVEKIVINEDRTKATVKLKDGTVKELSSNGLRLMQIFNLKVRELENFTIDGTFSGTVNHIDLENRKVKYTFTINRNGQPFAGSYFYSERSLGLEEIQDTIISKFLQKLESIGYFENPSSAIAY